VVSMNKIFGEGCLKWFYFQQHQLHCIQQLGQSNVRFSCNIACSQLLGTKNQLSSIDVIVEPCTYCISI